MSISSSHWESSLTYQKIVVFIGLNVVRALSIIFMLLVFASSILVMVTDVKAVNAFMSGKSAGDSTDDVNCDYIG